jgi:hypothetical protein
MAEGAARDGLAPGGAAAYVGPAALESLGADYRDAMRPEDRNFNRPGLSTQRWDGGAGCGRSRQSSAFGGPSIGR